MSEILEKVAAVSVIGAGVALTLYGVGNAFSGISNVFNSITSPEARFATKVIGGALGGYFGGQAMAIAGGHLHRRQELGALWYMGIYGAIGLVGGALGGYRLANNALPPLPETNTRPAVVSAVNPGQNLPASAALRPVVS